MSENPIADLIEVQSAVFGLKAGDEPDVYEDYDRLCELARKMDAAITDIRGRLAQAELDAARWRALMSTPRIRMYGSAGVDTKTGERTAGTHVHFGADFWTTAADEPANGQSGAESTSWGIHCLTALADALIEKQAATPEQVAA